ncbi:sensor histidine kinase [Acidimangrovimonas sediminis]|uniref:sensor histidine kinase n=1 Tax=Acidimangrovimonas sediminis TaxID=2056283 RepID=UPI000C7FC9A3|nr:HAMP domain-containing sensor histidine kinase [Acidimangrovimonas sediminis]
MKPLLRLAPFDAIGRSSAMRLAARLTAVFTVAILLAGAVSFAVLTEELRARLDDQAQQLAKGLADTLRKEGAAALSTQIGAYTDAVDDHYSLYLFVGPGGKVLAGNITAPATFTGRKILRAGKDMTLLSGEPDEQDHSFAAYGIRVGDAWIVAGRDTVWIGDSREVLVQSLGWGLGAALLISILFATMLARRSEERISRINGVLDAVACGDLSRRARDARDDDIGRIAGSLNRTLDQLELSIEGLRQVSNDVAHDLRTPLTRLRNRLEPLLARDDLPPGADTQIAKAVEETESLVRTFNAVLRIAQLEGDSARPEMRPLDLSALARDVVEMVDLVAEDAGDSLTLNASGPAMVLGDRDMIAQALTNLVENAIRYCPAPARIEVSVIPDLEGAILAVSDDGPGIPGPDRTRALRRFVRLDSAREGEGSGLGLSLVAAVMRQHGAALTLRDNPDAASGRPGLRVSARFPKAGD